VCALPTCTEDAGGADGRPAVPEPATGAGPEAEPALPPEPSELAEAGPVTVECDTVADPPHAAATMQPAPQTHARMPPIPSTRADFVPTVHPKILGISAVCCGFSVTQCASCDRHVREHVGDEFMRRRASSSRS
jgi:hypothetical protein